MTRYTITEELADSSIRNIESLEVRRVAIGAARDLVRQPTGPDVARVTVWDSLTQRDIFSGTIDRKESSHA